MRRSMLLLTSMVFCAAAVSANTPPPHIRSAKAIDTSLSIRIDKTATEARLIIPKTKLKQLRAEIDTLDTDTGNTAAVQPDTGRIQTIAGGLLLSLGIAFGGLWAVRSGKLEGPANKGIAAAVALFLCGSAATFVFANAGPPPEARSITGKLFVPAVHMYKQAWGNIKLEVSDTSKNIELIVPESAAEKTAE